MPDRFFPDRRNGCIAVCDSRLRTPGVGSLGEHAPGVTRFYLGEPVSIARGRVWWEVPAHKVRAAEALCRRLNEEEKDNAVPV